ncbi:MAG: glycosyltransferase [Sporolactobacillus sp.]
MKNIHVLVASAMWDHDQLRYRRHRLAEYLNALPETEAVIWLCPSAVRASEQLIPLKNGISQWVVSDVLPHRLFRFTRFIDCFYRQKMQTFFERLRAFNGRFYLWYTFPGYPLLASSWRWQAVIYDCSDLWTAPISGRQSLLSNLRRAVIGRSEQRIVRRATRIYCTSDGLHDTLIRRYQLSERRPRTLENGVAFDAFAAPAAQEMPLPEAIHEPILGYIGGIKPKLDFSLISEAATRHPEWNFLFVGPDRTGGSAAFQQLIARKNVHWLGSIPPAQVPGYVRAIQVGIMPYKPSLYNAAVFPLKLFEFLAAGKPVVGTGLPSTAKYAEEGVYVHLEHSSPAAFTAACERLLAGNGRKMAAQRQMLAQRQDWQMIFARMTAFLIR